MKKKILSEMIMLFIGVFMFLPLPSVSAEESIGGQVSTKGVISFYDELESSQITSSRPSSNGSSHKGILPKTGEIKETTIIATIGAFLLISITIYYCKHQRRSRQ